MTKRLIVVMLALLALVAMLAPVPASARKPAPRVGGKVKAAWPQRGKPPRGQLQRWLARQVGARVVKRHRRTAAAASVTALSAGAPSPERLVFESPQPEARLRLVRSFEIPANDPSYARLLNMSFTYDSAVAASAFIGVGSRAQAEQLLDQLAALQRSDGSIDYAFDTSSGAGTPTFRSGAIAWVALSAAYHKRTYGSTRYDAVARRALDWLLERQVPASGGQAAGLLRGGPDVPWISTQHNILAWFALSHMGGSRYEAAADAIASGIDSRLLVRSGSSAHFMQGLDDPVRPLDVQTLGVLYLNARRNSRDAERVATSILTNHVLFGRSIGLSADTATFNGTYSAPGPFAGFRPYADAGSPDVIWAEGTRQARLAFARLGADVRLLDAETARWDAVAPGDGPLQANRTITANDFNEYHVWPASAAASWTLLSERNPQKFLSR